MSVQQALGEDSGLLFAWEHPTRRKAALTGFIVASLLFHALCFYAFQIIYPPTVALLPPPGRVTLIAPTSDEGCRLLRWLEAEDPALASTTQRPPTAKGLAMPTIQHAPSYLMRQPTLRELPPDAPEPAIPSAHPPGPVEPLHPWPQPVTKAVPTIVRLSAGLETLGSLQSPKMNFKLAGAESPQVAQFRLGVDRQQLEARRRAPHLAQQTGVYSWRLGRAGQQDGRNALEQIGLLIFIQPAGNAAPKNPPFDFVLHLIGERQASGVYAAGLFDTEIVAGEAEAGAQTEAAEIEPAYFKCRALLASVGALEEHVG